MKMKASNKNLHVTHLLCVDIQQNNYFSFVNDRSETKFREILRIFQRRTLTHPVGHKFSSTKHTIQINLPSRNSVRKGFVDV